MITITQRTVRQEGNTNASADNPIYRLHCHGCGQEWQEPRTYYVSRAIAWAHQHKLAADPRRLHAIEFVHVPSDRGNNG